MPVLKVRPNPAKLNPDSELPYELRRDDILLAMQDVYDFFFDVNTLLLGKGLKRLDEMLRPAAMSGIISDMMTGSLAKHARSLVENQTLSFGRSSNHSKQSAS